MWTLCLSLTAIDIGIVQRFGVEAGAHFVSRCCDSDLIQCLWDTLGLGPLITETHETTALDIKRAFYRLNAFLLRKFGLLKCLTFVKMSCDPVERLGDDVNSVLAYKDPKTFLQELLQANRGSPPSYCRTRAPNSLDHDPEWVCVLSIGQDLNVSCCGASKRDAELRAAELMLTSLGAHPLWSSRLDQFRAEAIERLAKRARSPIFNNSALLLRQKSGEISRIIKEWDVNLDPRLLLTAFTPPSAKKWLSNADLAFVGSFVFAVYHYDRIILSSSYNLTEAQTYDCLEQSISSEGWLFRIYPNAKLISRRQKVDLIQAIVAAVFFSNDLETTTAWLGRRIDPLLNVPDQVSTKTAGKPPALILASIPNQYSDSVSFTGLLQNYTQSLQPPARPMYRYSNRGPGHAPIQECWASFDGLIGYAEAPKKATAANRAAHGLSIALRRRQEHE